jgi:DNA-binding GntR family transcriptional regulator
MQAGPDSVRTSPRRGLVDHVHDAVMSAILDHRIPPGHRINVESLARRLQVSPTPVREALARLEADGLVQRELSKGWSTTPVLDRLELVELFELRELLEPWAAARAARRASDDDRRRLRLEMARIQEAPTQVPLSPESRACPFVRHDRRFHASLARIAGNAEVIDALERSRWHVHHTRLLHARTGATPGTALAEHHRVAEAVVAGDEESAEAAMLDHLRSSRQRMLALDLRTDVTVADPPEAAQ